MRFKWSKFFFNSFLVIIIVIGIILGLFFLKTSFTFSKISSKNAEKDQPFYLLPELEDVPEKDKNKINFLLLGIRGEGEPFGGLLTDAIMVASFQKNTGRLALISLPRDLYIPMPNSTHRDKLNAAYAWGYSQGGVKRGISYIKDTVSRITGLYLDYAVVINFRAFEKFINSIGGLNIYLEREFTEDKQWGCDLEGKNCWRFSLPIGENHLDGETALLYIRSRFSSSDFDRSRREQKVILAVKNQVFSLGFLTNPIKIFNALDIVGENVRTDMELNDLRQLISLLRSTEIDFSRVKNVVFDNSEQGLLYSRYLNGLYILLPKAGDFSEIRKTCQDIFTQ